MQFFKNQGADGNSLLPKEEIILGKEVNMQESAPETSIGEFDMMVSTDSLNYHQIHSEPQSDIAIRLQLPTSPFESGSRESRLNMAEPQQDIRARLLQKSELFDAWEFSGKSSSDTSSLILKDSNDQRYGFCGGDDDDNVNSELDVDEKYILFDTSDFESTGDRSKNPENDIRRPWSSADQIRERLLQASPSGLCNSFDLLGENADLNEEPRLRFLKSKIDDVRARLQERQESELLDSEKNIGVNVTKSESKDNETSFELMKYRIDNIRERLQLREQNDDFETRESDMEDHVASPERSYKSRIESIRERLQQKNAIDVDWCDNKDEVDIVNGSSWNPDSQENNYTDAGDREWKSKQLIESMLNDLDRLENIEHGSQEEGSISEVEYKHTVGHSNEFPGMVDNASTILDIKEDNCINEEEIEVQRMSETPTRLSAEFWKAETDTEELFEKRIRDQQEIDFDVFDNVESQGAVEHHSDQEIRELANFKESLRAHLSLNESPEIYRVLSLNEEDVCECATTTGSRNEDRKEMPLQYTSHDEEIITDYVIEPVSRPPLSSIEIRTEKGIEILDMLDEFESGIEISDVHEDTGQQVEFDEKSNRSSPNSKHTLDDNPPASNIDCGDIEAGADHPEAKREEEKCYDLIDAGEIQTTDSNIEMIDADFSDQHQLEDVSDSESNCSSSRSILRSPLTKGLQLMYEGTDIAAETDGRDTADWIHTCKEFPRADTKEIRVLADLIESPIVDLRQPGSEDTQNKGLDEKLDGILLQKQEEHNSVAFSSNEILNADGFAGHKCAQTNEPVNPISDIQLANIYIDEKMKGDKAIEISGLDDAEEINHEDLTNHKDIIPEVDDGDKIAEDDLISSCSNLSSSDVEGHSLVVSRGENQVSSMLDSPNTESTEPEDVASEQDVSKESIEDKDSSLNETLDIDSDVASSTEEHLESVENGASSSHTKDRVVHELKAMRTSKDSSYPLDATDGLGDTGACNLANEGADDLENENDLFGDVLSIGPVDGSKEEEEKLDIVSSLCRENSFVNKAVIVELSHEDHECKGASVTLGNAGDLREEYRTRADLQNLPDELLENLPLNFSQRFDLTSVTLQGPFIGETSGSDSQSEASIPDTGLSDSEEEIEFGPGNTDEDQSESGIKDSQGFKGLRDITHTDKITDGFSHSFEKHMKSVPCDVQSAKCTDSLEAKTELEKTSDQTAGIHFTNDWFESSQSELDYVSRLDSNVLPDENEKIVLMTKINSSSSECIKSHDTIGPQHDFVAVDVEKGDDLEEFAPTGDGKLNMQIIPIEDAEESRELGPSKQNVNKREKTLSTDSKVEILREFISEEETNDVQTMSSEYSNVEDFWELGPSMENANERKMILSVDSSMENVIELGPFAFAPTEEDAGDAQKKVNEDSSVEDLREFEEMELLFENEDLMADSSKSISQVNINNSCEFNEYIATTKSCADMQVEEGIILSLVININCFLILYKLNLSPSSEDLCLRLRDRFFYFQFIFNSFSQAMKFVSLVIHQSNTLLVF